MGDPDWDDFRLMLALSRGGSIAGAGRVLGIDSSTVSRRLAAMEQSLGACLVLRGGREFALTAEGKAAVAAAVAMEAVVLGAATSIRAAKTDIEGVVRVSSVPSMLRLLAGLPATAADMHPNLSVEVTAARQTVDLAKGEADIAIRMARPREIDLVSKRAFEMGFGVFAAKTYVERCGLAACAEDLSGHRLILYAEPMLHLPWFSWLERFSLKGAPSTRVDSTDLATGLCIAGSGIAVLPCSSGDATQELVRVLPDPIAYATGWIVYHETARNSARVRAVIDILIEFLDARKATLSGHRSG